MKKSYWVLLVIVLVAAVGLSFVSRQPNRAPLTRPVEANRPVSVVSVAIDDGAMVPARTSVPKGHDVQLQVTNGDAHEVQVELAGYGDRVAFRLESGATWEGAFTADRPGEDFMWIVDGAPAGRFDVLGSHLVEGHR